MIPYYFQVDPPHVPPAILSILFRVWVLLAPQDPPHLPHSLFLFLSLVSCPYTWGPWDIRYNTLFCMLALFLCLVPTPLLCYLTIIGYYRFGVTSPITNFSCLTLYPEMLCWIALIFSFWFSLIELLFFYSLLSSSYGQCQCQDKVI